MLFMLDMDKNGKISLRDMQQFAVWCGLATEHMASRDPQSFQSEVQAQCTLAMWKQVCLVDGGRRAFSEWFQRLFSVGMAVRLPQHPDRVFVNNEAVATLHDVLSIQELYGINYQSLIDLMQRVAEDMGDLDLYDSTLDNLIPIRVLHIFADNFIEGFVNMMQSLDFTPDKYRSVLRGKSIPVDQSDQSIPETGEGGAGVGEETRTDNGKPSPLDTEDSGSGDESDSSISTSTTMSDSLILSSSSSSSASHSSSSAAAAASALRFDDGGSTPQRKFPIIPALRL